MAKAGWEVLVLDKQSTPGGRARQLKQDGFVFDMGPSWYWMPDVFERYFAQFGKKVSDYYSLERLSPSYRVYWEDGPMDIPSDFKELSALFESLEPGAARQLEAFLKEAAYKYQVGMQKLVFKPGQSIVEFMDRDVISGMFRLDIFSSMKTHVRKYFTHPRIRMLMEFPVLFLGALPSKTPALYSLMNYADIVGGTWYPQGGIYRVVQAMADLAVELGVRFHFNEEVTEIITENRMVKKVKTSGAPEGKGSKNEAREWEADVVIGGADYHHIETNLLPASARSYSAAYWEQRQMAPSCLLYYVGLNKRLAGIRHHNLFFDVPFEEHARQIYTSPQWPDSPLFYLSVPSQTDDSVAPPGCENLFFLVPVASGLAGDSAELREKYFEAIVRRMEHFTGQSIADSIVYKSTFAGSDFFKQYHAFKGNAYGLANTLMQTAILKPSCKSRKLDNLFYTGQLTVPGPGVPPSLVSGEVVAKEILKQFN